MVPYSTRRLRSLSTHRALVHHGGGVGGRGAAGHGDGRRDSDRDQLTVGLAEILNRLLPLDHGLMKINGSSR